MTEPNLTRDQLKNLADEVRTVLTAALMPDAETVKPLRAMKKSTLKRISFTRVEALQRLEELACWLYIYRRDSETLAIARPMLAFQFSGDYDLYNPVEWILALAALLADRHGDQDLASACSAHITAVYGTPESWSDYERQTMDNRLGGYLVEWQERNRPADDEDYTRSQLGELAFLRLWGGSVKWPMDRIMDTFEEKTAYLRAMVKVA